MKKLMKNFWPMVLALIPFNPIAAQEVQHAPTVDQCRADQRLWLSKLEVPKGAGVANVSYKELDGWFQEMYGCESVDPQHKIQYFNTWSETTIKQQMRLEDYLNRHRLYDQFVAEDAQGKR
jgi:hypothetical protein